MLGILTAGILNGSSHLWAGKAISPKDSRSFFPLILSRFAPLAFHTEGFTFSQGNEGMTTCDDKRTFPPKKDVFTAATWQFIENIVLHRQEVKLPGGDSEQRRDDVRQPPLWVGAWGGHQPPCQPPTWAGGDPGQELEWRVRCGRKPFKGNVTNSI